MILRDAQLSERRYSLPSSSTVGAAGDRLRSVEPGLGAKHEPANLNTVTRLTPTDVALAASTSEIKEPKLTFESVVAWLAVQDQETRKGCASILATEVTKIHELAKAEGLAAGQRAAESMVKQEIQGNITLLQEIAVNAQQAFDREQEQLQGICVEVVAEALAKIAGPLLASEQAAQGAIREVLLRVKDAREITIRVAREDFEMVRRFEKNFADLLGNRKYEFVSDSRVELGGCIVETKLGSLDGRLEVQLRELYETLRLAKLSTPELP
jgi:flagellar assembly protein FliH